tara:strand:- start:8384 stop:9724 length:1341 start_codon:yes stop_codon:yes gene_type:complete
MSSDIAISVQNLSKCYQIFDKPQDRLKQMLFGGSHRYYSEFWALDNVSFEVKRGETVGIIGRNGSGKSTLLQMICGTLNPTSGDIKVSGRVAALLELGSGFNPEFTGRENVFMNASVLGLTREQIHSRYQDIVDFADIGAFIDQPTKTYSSGMMVRLAFAVIAHVDADVLVIDEALAVGDAFFTQKCMRYLRNFMKNGTILFVSHDTSSVRNLCSKAIWIEKGKVLKEGSSKEVCEDYLEAFYEAQQGKGTTTRIRADKDPSRPAVFKDQRSTFINASSLRNDLQLFEFDSTAPSFGKGHAQVTSVEFLDVEAHPLAWIVGGEDVILKIEACVHAPLDSPIVGFFVKDKLGQALFGDNTWLSYIDEKVIFHEGDIIVAEFAFQMPRLATGDYSITVAVANGTQEEHVQHHWVHDAVVFKSETTSVASGIVGIPMNRIELKLGGAGE